MLRAPASSAGAPSPRRLTAAQSLRARSVRHSTPTRCAMRASSPPPAPPCAPPRAPSAPPARFIARPQRLLVTGRAARAPPTPSRPQARPRRQARAWPSPAPRRRPPRAPPARSSLLRERRSRTASAQLALRAPSRPPRRLRRAGPASPRPVSCSPPAAQPARTTPRPQRRRRTGRALRARRAASARP